MVKDKEVVKMDAVWEVWLDKASVGLFGGLLVDIGDVKPQGGWR